MLARNIASLQRQTSADWTQTLLVDEVGRGIDWSYRNLADYAPHLVGSYIWILDDDDECVSETLVHDLQIIALSTGAEVVMLKMDHGERGVLPDAAHWLQPPACGAIGVSAFVVERSLWRKHAPAMRQHAHYTSDYEFITAIWRDRPRTFWLDRVASRCQRISHGQPEPRDFDPVGAPAA